MSNVYGEQRVVSVADKDMAMSYRIAAYERISIDLEPEGENTSIENQKSLIEKYVRESFPQSSVEHFSDRDRSGYTFGQREEYQRMRKQLSNGKFDILIINDFSRFSRRNGAGLVELEELRDMGIRIVAISNGVDYPTNDDWLKIQIHFFVNEMPVTESSKKVRNVISMRQKKGEWVCAVPYGYVFVDTKKMRYEVDPVAAEIVRLVFDLYAKGYGYKRIAHQLTDMHILTPRLLEKQRKEQRGEEYRAVAKQDWSIVTIQKMLINDFYIGTLRQRKYARKKINGIDVRLDESDHQVFENAHEPIIDSKTWFIVQSMVERRSKSNTHYRGIKKNPNIYSGLVYCGDCGSYMITHSAAQLKQRYICGNYHKHGLRKCTSHHTRVDTLDGIFKSYIQNLMNNSTHILARLQKALDDYDHQGNTADDAAERIKEFIVNVENEIRVTKRQKIREIMKNPSEEELLEEVYKDIEQELVNKLRGLQAQLDMAQGNQVEVSKMERYTRTVTDVFQSILDKQQYERTDIELMFDKIVVYDDRIDIKLKHDVDMLFNYHQEESTGSYVQSAKNQNDKTFSINVINEGDPCRIE